MTGLFQLLVLVSITLAAEPSCPACSKYDYEERILEKVIRMEFTFEKVLNEHKAASKTVEEDLARMKGENERLRAVNDDLKDQQEQSEGRLVLLMEELARNQSSTMDKIIADSNRTLEQVGVAFNNIKDQVMVPAVYFHARSPQTSSLSAGEIIVYTRVETNQGDGYSSTTGKFTAPARGLYMFFMHTCAYPNKNAYLQIVKEGSVLMASFHYDKDYYACSSSQTFVQLDAGENVWVKCHSGGQLHDNHPNWWTSFGGALIHNSAVL